MFKHIIIQAIYQIFVMVMVIFLGHKILPEEWDKEGHGAYATFNPSTGEYEGVEGYNKEPREWYFGLYTVRSGLFMYDEYENPLHTNSRHFAYCFNIFVMMQVFNFINARKIDDSVNTFKGILRSPIFVSIVAIIFVLQFMILTFGSFAFKVTLFVPIVLILLLGVRANWMVNIDCYWSFWNGGQLCDQVCASLDSLPCKVRCLTASAKGELIRVERSP